MKIADLFAEVSFKWDTIKLNELGKKIGDLNLSSVVSTASMVKLGETIKDTLEASIQTSKALTTLSEATLIPTDYIQKFEQFAQVMGSTKEEADGFLNTIGKLQLAIAQGRGNIRPWTLLGINPMGKSKEEVSSLIASRFSDENFLKNFASRYAKDAHSVDEMRAELKRQIAGDIGISDFLMRMFSSKDFNKEMGAKSSFSVLSPEEIASNNKALAEFTRLTQKLNLEFTKTADILLPKITTLLENFRSNGGLKFVIDSLKYVRDSFERFGIIGTYLQAGAMNINNALQQPLIANRRNFAEGQKHYQQQTTVNVTVHSNTPEEFVRKFDPVWKKHIANADLHFGQST